MRYSRSIVTGSAKLARLEVKITVFGVELVRSSLHGNLPPEGSKYLHHQADKRRISRFRDRILSGTKGVEFDPWEEEDTHSQNPSPWF